MIGDHSAEKGYDMAHHGGMALGMAVEQENCRIADCRASHHALPVSEITIFRLLARVKILLWTFEVLFL